MAGIRPVRCCEVRQLAALARKPRSTPGREVKITGHIHARITQLACTKPPAGHARWTLRLLARHLVEIEVIETISHQSVGTVLKKRTQAMAARTLVHPTQAKRLLRSGDGRRAGGLFQGTATRPAVGLYG